MNMNKINVQLKKKNNNQINDTCQINNANRIKVFNNRQEIANINLADDDSQTTELTIGIYSIFIGKYTMYYEPFIAETDIHFLPDFKKKYFIITDTDLDSYGKDITFVKVSKIGWPYETLYRYKYFLLFDSDDVSACDVVYFFNSNVTYARTINEEVIPYKEGYVFVTHHGYYNKTYTHTSYEKNYLSTAYVQSEKGGIYVGGGFFGATTAKFIAMCEILNQNTTADELNNYIAVWHDESHLNWFANVYLECECKFLDISYHIPEELIEHFTKITIVYKKKQDFIKNATVVHYGTIHNNTFNQHLVDDYENRFMLQED